MKFKKSREKGSNEDQYENVTENGVKYPIYRYNLDIEGYGDLDEKGIDITDTYDPRLALTSRGYSGTDTPIVRGGNWDPNGPWVAVGSENVKIDEYEIIGLNLKSQLNQGFRGLVLFLLTLKIADKAIHRRQYAQNRNLSAERGAASLCSASTRHTLPTYISFRRSTELSTCVDLHRLPLRQSTHVPVARAA